LAQLGKDSEFRALYHVASQEGANILTARIAMKPAERAQVKADLASGNQARIDAALARSGITEAQLARAHELAAALQQRYDLPLTPATTALLEQAATNEHARLAQQGGGPAEDDPLGDLIDQTSSGGSGGDDSACWDLCAAEFTAAAASAYASYFAALFGCQVLGPGWPICVAGATAAWGLALYEANEALEGCQSKCR
jgi:hypothetical protein